MLMGILLRNVVNDVGPALQMEAFVSVSLPISAVRLLALSLRLPSPDTNVNLATVCWS